MIRHVFSRSGDSRKNLRFPTPLSGRFVFLLFFLLIPLIGGQIGCSLRGASTDPGKAAGGGKGPRGTKPYTIKGKTYYPLLSAHGFREEGIASWYGPGFHGEQTANGERYDMHGMTAAHKLLPFGTDPVILESVGAVAGLEGGNLKGRFYVQVGAFANQSNADRLVGKLKQQGKGGRTYFADQVGFWRVQAGPYASLNEAESAAAGMLREYPGNFVVAE